jgi:hypothetical protein
LPSGIQSSGSSTCWPSRDALREHAEPIAQPVAERRQPELRERVEEAGREPAQAAVAEGRVALVLERIGERDAVRRERIFDQRARPSAASALPSERPIRNSIDR